MSHWASFLQWRGEGGAMRERIVWGICCKSQKYATAVVRCGPSSEWMSEETNAWLKKNMATESRGPFIVFPYSHTLTRSHTRTQRDTGEQKGMRSHSHGYLALHTFRRSSVTADTTGCCRLPFVWGESLSMRRWSSLSTFQSKNKKKKTKKNKKKNTTQPTSWLSTSAFGHCFVPGSKQTLWPAPMASKYWPFAFCQFVCISGKYFHFQCSLARLCRLAILKIKLQTSCSRVFEAVCVCICVCVAHGKLPWFPRTCLRWIVIFNLFCCQHLYNKYLNVSTAFGSLTVSLFLFSFWGLAVVCNCFLIISICCLCYWATFWPWPSENKLSSPLSVENSFQLSTSSRYGPTLPLMCVSWIACLCVCVWNAKC